MKRIVCLVLFAFAIFCVVARGESFSDTVKQNTPAAKVDPPKADPPAAVDPVKPGQAILLTVPPQAAPVVVTTPEVPTLADQVTKLIGMLSGLVALAWTIYQEARHKFQQFRDTQSTSPRPWTDEEYLAETKRRFPK